MANWPILMESSRFTADVFMDRRQCGMTLPHRMTPVFPSQRVCDDIQDILPGHLQPL
jgi:hypothetical protein